MEKVAVKLPFGHSHIQSSNPVIARSTRAGDALFMPTPRTDIQLIRMLSERLERISADSIWAHRASGVRGSLLRILEEDETGRQPDPETVSLAIATSLHILTRAAKRE
jgi:hypothetical protein